MIHYIFHIINSSISTVSRRVQADEKDDIIEIELSYNIKPYIRECLILTYSFLLLCFMKSK